MKTVWEPFFQGAVVGDLFHPKVAFSSEDKAMEWINKQPGYRLGIDWFLRELVIDPE